MQGREILANNHDLHMHTRQFSDGWHDWQELIAFGTRWQKGAPWLGISDHSPLITPIAPNLAKETTAARIRRAEIPIPDAVRREIDAKARDYARQARLWQTEARRRGIDILIGMEVDWTQAEPVIGHGVLADLDYCLMAYHARGCRDKEAILKILTRMIRHAFCDVLAHPDSFLGTAELDPDGWRQIFDEMAEMGVLCEYNLSTPLRPEVYRIAKTESDVMFVIGSDIHDFRSRATRRIMDAWAESQGGGFEPAFAYLQSFVNSSSAKDARLAALFDSPQKLADLEWKVYRARRRFHPEPSLFDADEIRLLQCLEADKSDQPDKAFWADRLERFSDIATRRVASLWPRKRFSDFVASQRRLRRARQAAASKP